MLNYHFVDQELYVDTIVPITEEELRTGLRDLFGESVVTTVTSRQNYRD